MHDIRYRERFQTQAKNYRFQGPAIQQEISSYITSVFLLRIRIRIIDLQWWLVSNLAFVFCTKQTRVSVDSTLFVRRYAVIQLNGAKSEVRSKDGVNRLSQALMSQCARLETMASPGCGRKMACYLILLQHGRIPSQ